MNVLQNSSLGYDLSVISYMKKIISMRSIWQSDMTFPYIFLSFSLTLQQSQISHGKSGSLQMHNNFNGIIISLKLSY